MLAQDVAGAGAFGITVKIMGLYGLKGGNAFDDLKLVCRYQQRLGRGVVAVVRAADALHKAFDVFRRADLDDQIDIAPIDAKIQRARADDGLERASHHCRLHLFTLRAVQRAVVNANRQAIVVGQPQIVEKDLGLCAGVVENQRGVVLLHLLQHRRDCVFAATPGPRGLFIGHEHLDVGVWPRVGLQDRAWVWMAGELCCDGVWVFDGCG